MSSSLSKRQAESETSVEIGGSKISFQVLQDIFNRLTGRSETLVKFYTISHRTRLEDIQNLNARIEQLTEQYNVATQNSSITFYRTDDTNSTHASFDLAALRSPASLSPIENVRLTYNLLIILPKLNEPQRYKIVIDITSQLAARERVRRESGFPRRFLGLFTRNTGRASISYVDYTVASNILNTINEWFQALDKTTTSKPIKFIQHTADRIPLFFQYLPKHASQQLRSSSIAAG